MALRTQKTITIAHDLAKDGKISAEQLQKTLEAQKKEDRDIGEYLAEQGLVTEDEFNQLLAAKAGVTAVSLAELTPDPSLLSALTLEQAVRWSIFPVLEKNGKLTIATSDPFDLAALDEAKLDINRQLDHDFV